MKNKITTLSSLLTMIVLLPSITYAAGVGELLEKVRGWLNLLVPMLITLGIIAFFWGLTKYLLTQGEDKKKGLDIMLMGILAVFVMGSIGGLVGLLQSTTGIDNGSNTINPPCVGKACNNS